MVLPPSVPLLLRFSCVSWDILLQVGIAKRMGLPSPYPSPYSGAMVLPSRFLVFLFLLSFPQSCVTEVLFLAGVAESTSLPFLTQLPLIRQNFCSWQWAENTGHDCPFSSSFVIQMSHSRRDRPRRSEFIHYFHVPTHSIYWVA